MSAVLQENPIESIFDHAIASEELFILTNGYPETKEEYFYALSQDSAYADLGRLYRIRNDEDKALFFINQIKDKGFRTQFIMRPCCVAHL